MVICDLLQSIVFLVVCTPKEGRCWMLYKTNQCTTFHTGFTKLFKKMKCSGRPKTRVQISHFSPPVLNAAISSNSQKEERVRLEAPGIVIRPIVRVACLSQITFSSIYSSSNIISNTKFKTLSFANRTNVSLNRTTTFCTSIKRDSHSLFNLTSLAFFFVSS